MKRVRSEDVALCFSNGGLIPAVVQDRNSGLVLMLAYMNRESLQRTIATGYAWFWSRSRQKLWKKGETSGHVQRVKEIKYDCDGDTLLLLVEPRGPACHSGKMSCFYRTLAGDVTGDVGWERGNFLGELREIIKTRLHEKPAGSYVAKLSSEGEDRIIQKIGEEATELVIACKNREREEITAEAADLIFHTLLALEWSGVSWGDVLDELQLRHAKKKEKKDD